jgi:hypothetical protein
VVLAVAPLNDWHARAVVQRLQELDVEVHWLELAELNRSWRLTLALDPRAEARLVDEAGNVVVAGPADTVWWRRPQAPAVEGLEQHQMDFVRSEWRHFLETFEAFSPARWVNSPAAERLANHKGRQLLAAGDLGLRTPGTLITNDPRAVRDVAEGGRALIYKRIGSAPRPATATRKLTSDDLGRLDQLPDCPAIFQELVPARMDIRVTMFGTELWAAEIDSQAGSSPLDWRLDSSVAMRPHQLDPLTQEQLRKLTARLGLQYAAIDLRLTPDGEYVFLEVNPSGQYLFVELMAELPLSRRMASFLAE